MSKRKRLHQKIAEAMMSIFVLAIFFVPMYYSARWIGGTFYHPDSRKVVKAVPFQTRPIDKSATPLKPFEEPIVTIAFDDGWESVYTNAFAEMQYEGLHSTQFIVTDTFNNKLYMSIAQLHAMQAAGVEIGSHTVTHSDLTKLSSDQLTHELVDSRATLNKEFGPIKDFTTPYGAYNSNVLKQVKLYYRSQKNTEGFVDSDGSASINVKKTFNPINYNSYSITKQTTLKDIRTLLAKTVQQKGWLVLTYHQVDNGGGEYSVTPKMFYDQMRLVSNSPMRSATVGQFMDILLPKWKAEH